MTEKEILKGEAEARLRQVRDCKAEYDRQSQTLEELETLAESITSHLSDMPKAHGSDHRQDDIWARLADQRSRVEEDLEYYLSLRHELEMEILDLIRKPSIRTAMLYRYINCMSIEEIARMMRYEERNIFYLLRVGKDIYVNWYVKKGGNPDGHL